MPASGVEQTEADTNLPTGSPQASTVEPGEGSSQARTNSVQVSTTVPTNVFTGTLHGTLGFTAA